MAYCSNCGAKLSKDGKFCSECGSPAGGAQTNEKRSRSEVWEDKVHKCPQCGEALQAFVSKCPSCGYELRGGIASESIANLAKQLEKASSGKKRRELIRDCYIPNSKEDIYEFFILATSNMKAGSPDSAAWSAKLEQAYQKAKLVLRDSDDLEGIERMYRDAKQKRAQNEFFGKIGKLFAARGPVQLIAGIVLMVMGMLICQLTGDDNAPLAIIGLIGLMLLLDVFEGRP